MPTFVYPPARREPCGELCHGVDVADPYRWLEDPGSEETRSFVAAQNVLTRAHLHGLAARAGLVETMRSMWDVPRSSAPIRRAGVTLWTFNQGLSEQPSFMVDDGRRPPHPILDPSTMSEDGAVAVNVASLSPDGRMLAYSVAEAGSDWQTIRIREVETGVDLDDVIHHVKFPGIAWHDGGFFYNRFPAQVVGSTDPSWNMTVHHHVIGDPQDRDTLVFANADDPVPGYHPSVTDTHLVLTEWIGTSVQNGVLVRPLDEPEAPFQRLVEPGVAMHAVLDVRHGMAICHTDLDAPNGRVVAIPLEDPGTMVELVGERRSSIDNAMVAAERLLVVWLEEASHTIELFDLDGASQGAVDLPGVGSVTEITGHPHEDLIGICFQSFVHPPTALTWQRGATEVFFRSPPPIDPSTVVVERRQVTSTDGASVGMFLVRSVDTRLPAPVELYGYGGFNISLTPSFSPARLAFIREGGVVAVANLRGGAELGEEWHRQGMLGNKQQVFDDFIACAEHLVSEGVAAPRGVGINGGSNGGLLTAACMLQRPELFGAVVSQVPVADMLRYHLFTAGRYWTVEYGDPNDAEAFAWLRAYSPYHNVEEGVALPPLLITTAESDDRVVPMHALKLAAAVQHAAGGSSDTPLLVRVETRAGHGLGKPTSKLIEASADVYAFLLEHLKK
jgi:prolyl oligopeptidase